MTKLLDHLMFEANQLSEGFKSASLLGEGTPQEISDFRENYFKTFLERYFPSPYTITKCKIYDSYENVSNSIDHVILNPMHPKTIDSQGKFSLVLADGVDYAIELKPDLKNESELRRGLKQMQSVKKLRRVESALRIKKHSEGYTQYLSTIPSFIYTMKSKKIHDFADAIEKINLEEKIPQEEQFDFIVVHNSGILVNLKAVELDYWNKDSECGGFLFEAWDENTLAGFLLRLSVMNESALRLKRPVIFNYLNKIRPNSGEYYTVQHWTS